MYTNAHNFGMEIHSMLNLESHTIPIALAIIVKSTILATYSACIVLRLQMQKSTVMSSTHSNIPKC